MTARGELLALADTIAIIEANFVMTFGTNRIDALKRILSRAAPGRCDAESDELAEWKQAASVEAGLRREFLARAEAAEAQLAALVPPPSEAGREAIALNEKLRNEIQRYIWDGAVRDISPYDTATSILLHIDAALSSDPGTVASAWLPIETAPKDGTPILAANSRHDIHAPVMVRWLDEMSNPDTGWCDAATASGDALYFNPNYFDLWMPAPVVASAQYRCTCGAEPYCAPNVHAASCPLAISSTPHRTPAD